MKFFKKITKKDKNILSNSKDAAKERLHLVLMQDRANVSADFLELMKQEIIEVIKKYIDVDESAIDVRLTNKENEDGTNGAPALYANIPILNIKNETRKMDAKETKVEETKKSGDSKELKENKITESKKQNEKQEEHQKENQEKDQEEHDVETSNSEKNNSEENEDAEVIIDNDQNVQEKVEENQKEQQNVSN